MVLGQTTVRVLKALLPFAEAQLKAARSDGTLNIRINDMPLKASDEAILHKNVAILDAPQTLDVTGIRICQRAAFNILLYALEPTREFRDTHRQRLWT